MQRSSLDLDAQVRFDVGGWCGVTLHVFDLDAFIHAGPDDDVVVYIDGASPTTVKKGELRNFSIPE